ncbi:MAG TPA: UDP-N-acetylglucosamine 2-epimerase, partial [Acidimicrobiales bacterium]|nr:UDP-N-acetylglucosamine 2-epimerase [Acidimicrobiales bacterium]
GVPGDLGAGGRILLVPPMGYTEFAFVQHSAIVITDSGGVQEETTFLGVPCATVRDTTERPVTISEGTNRLVACEDLPGAIADALGSRWPIAGPPPLWDGQAAARAAASLARAHGR